MSGQLESDTNCVCFGVSPYLAAAVHGNIVETRIGNLDSEILFRHTITPNQ